jgi:hypothetical protein
VQLEGVKFIEGLFPKHQATSSSLW